VTTARCPRCADALTHGACARDCGEWIEAAALPAVRLEPARSDAREPRLPCPRCGQPMEARTWGTTPYDRCEHGVWLEGRARERFHAQLSAAIDTEREIARLEAYLADPAGRRELAARLVHLEQRCERLERELARVDQRLTKARLDRWDIP
jgi:hypothetical protein